MKRLRKALNSTDLLKWGAIGLCLVLTGACAQRSAPPALGAAGSARVGWVIMAGDRDSPDRDFVCQSNPRSECVLEHSQADAQVFSHLHFYFHPARSDTRYRGAIRIEFFGDGPQDLEADLTVESGDDAGNHSVVGIVTGRPGTYTMAISVEATSAEAAGAEPIRENVTIVVK